MDKELFSTIQFSHHDSGSLNASSLTFDLPTLIENIKHERTPGRLEESAFLITLASGNLQRAEN